MQLNSYLLFDGRCEAAFQFYEQCLGARIVTMFKHTGTCAEQQVPPEWREKIMHARLQLGDSTLMGSDAPPDRYQPPKGFYVQLAIREPADAQRVFRALSENGTVRMPLQETFWARRFAMLVDRFGIPWMINCAAEAAA